MGKLPNIRFQNLRYGIWFICHMQKDQTCSQMKRKSPKIQYMWRRNNKQGQHFNLKIFSRLAVIQVFTDKHCIFVILQFPPSIRDLFYWSWHNIFKISFDWSMIDLSCGRERSPDSIVQVWSKTGISAAPSLVCQEPTSQEIPVGLNKCVCVGGGGTRLARGPVADSSSPARMCNLTRPKQEALPLTKWLTHWWKFRKVLEGLQSMFRGCWLGHLLQCSKDERDLVTFKSILACPPVLLWVK